MKLLNALLIKKTLLLSVIFTLPASTQTEHLEGIVPYKVQKDKSSIYGQLNCKGSTNVGKLLKVWLPKFEKLYPEVNSTLAFKGSSDGIASLMDETANIGASSRPIRQSEISSFQTLKGYAPTEIKVSLDALAVYVNRLNKLEMITIEELDAIFSTTQKQGYPTPITEWTPLTKEKEKINIYLFDKNSGTRSYFRHQVMLKGAYNTHNIISDDYMTTREVVSSVAEDKYGICFGSVGSNNFKVKTLGIAKRKYYPTYQPNAKDIKCGNYPLTRFFYLYMDVPPDKPIPKLLYEFCKFILSEDGQKEILKLNGIPLSPKQIGVELSKIRRE